MRPSHFVLMFLGFFLGFMLGVVGIMFTQPMFWVIFLPTITMAWLAKFLTEKEMEY